MTRFARAEGSKASNKRVPEEASSWMEMKKQLSDKKNAENSEAEYQQKNNNKTSPLKDKELKSTMEWCVFSDEESKKKKNKDKSLKINDGKVSKKKRKSKQKNKLDLNVPNSEIVTNEKDEVSEEKPISEADEFMNKKCANKNDNMGQKGNKNNKHEGNNAQILYNKKGHPYKKKIAKTRDKEEHQRRKPNKDVEKIFINGKFIEVMKYDGFPVMKDDFERLVQLKKTLISRGIPKSEVKMTMLKERRRAEKAFAREKKKVCFQCRKSGHVLSECPELGHDNVGIQTSGTGMCFKCGSTEHTHFECKVVRTQEFKFAECFICKEKGHIARQCPDNPRGLYPKGGGCRICGSVTHLKKDCPQNQQDNEEKTITLPTKTMGVEGLENETKVNINISSTTEIIDNML